MLRRIVTIMTLVGFMLMSSIGSATASPDPADLAPTVGSDISFVFDVACGSAETYRVSLLVTNSGDEVGSLFIGVSLNEEFVLYPGETRMVAFFGLPRGAAAVEVFYDNDDPRNTYVNDDLVDYDECAMYTKVVQTANVLVECVDGLTLVTVVLDNSMNEDEAIFDIFMGVGSTASISVPAGATDVSRIEMQPGEVLSLGVVSSDVTLYSNEITSLDDCVAEQPAPSPEPTPEPQPEPEPETRQPTATPKASPSAQRSSASVAQRPQPLFDTGPVVISAASENAPAMPNWPWWSILFGVAVLVTIVVLTAKRKY